MSRLKPPPRIGTPAFEAAILDTGDRIVEANRAAATQSVAPRKIGADMSEQTDALDTEILSRLEALGPGSHARKALDGADDPAKVRASLGRLVDAGKVLKIGRKKGTRYALPTPDEETPAA